MSSFKRKTSSRPELPAGTRHSPSCPTTLLTSTGIPSLDDILGGGLPMSCSSLILAPDPHSSYGQLVGRYYIAQGLVSNQRICVIDDNAKQIVEDCMWTPANGSVPDDKQEREDAVRQDEQIKIAWRYETMKPFQTTVDAGLNQSSTDEFCETFDLTCRIPRLILDKALESKQIVNIDLDPSDGQMALQYVIKLIGDMLSASFKPWRICIPSLGSPSWGEPRPQDILYFLHAVRSLLRQHQNVCAMICLSPHMATDTWGGTGWMQKLGWAVDAAITLTAFTANPIMSSMFPSHHGLAHIQTLPAPHTIRAPSDKISTLRGMSSTGGGENNLAFKCTRKRMKFETLHLDVMGDRRTETKGRESMAVKVEGHVKKRVGFSTDRPDLYDF